MSHRYFRSGEQGQRATGGVPDRLLTRQRQDQHPSVTRALNRWSEGYAKAGDQAFSALYSELRRIASAHLRNESARELRATSLVHEAYLRLEAGGGGPWTDRVHFLSFASTVMRRVLIDLGRRRRRLKRTGGRRAVRITDVEDLASEPAVDVLEVHRALEELGDIDPELERLVELRFFGGLTISEAAECLEISVPTVNRRWRVARAFLYDHLRGGG